MHHCWWGPHCPYHHGYYPPNWAEPYSPPPAYAPPGGGYPQPSRDEYLRRLESDRDMLEQRLRRLEQQLADLQRSAGRSG
jgi:hypothetical protein